MSPRGRPAPCQGHRQLASRSEIQDVLSGARGHTHMCTHPPQAHTRSYTRTQAHGGTCMPHVFTLPCTCTYVLTQEYVHTHPHSPTLFHTPLHTRTCSHAHRCTHTRSLVPTHTCDALAHSHMHTLSPHMYPPPCTPVCTHVHCHTRLHTYAAAQSCCRDLGAEKPSCFFPPTRVPTIENNRKVLGAGDRKGRWPAHRRSALAAGHWEACLGGTPGRTH